MQRLSLFPVRVGLESGAGYVQRTEFRDNHRAELDDQLQQTDPSVTNLPHDAAGNVIAPRATPRGAGFGVANACQAARSIQAQVRFSL